MRAKVFCNRLRGRLVLNVLLGLPSCGDFGVCGGVLAPTPTSARHFFFYISHTALMSAT
jgi:hypothetical protein